MLFHFVTSSFILSFLLFLSVLSLSSHYKSTSLYQYSLIILSQSAQEAKHFVFLRKIFVLVTKTRKILYVFSLFFRVSFRAETAEHPVDVRFATTGAERRLQNIRWTFALQRPKRSGDCRTSGGRSLCNDRSEAETSNLRAPTGLTNQNLNIQS